MSVNTYPLPIGQTIGTTYSQRLAGTGYGGNSMDPFSAIIGGGAQLLGGIFSARSARKQNEAMIRQAQKQMDFQERMSSTAYQRAAVDLEKAGLNRVLALGRPASSPGGAMAQQVNEGQQAINTALAVRRASAEIKNINANTAKTVAETANVGLTGSQIFQQTEKFRQEYSNLQKTGEILGVNKQISEALAKIRGSEAVIIKSEADLWRTLQSVGSGEAGMLAKLIGPNALTLLKLAIHAMKGR